MTGFSGAHLAHTEPELSETTAHLAVDDAPTKCDLGQHSCGFLVTPGAEKELMHARVECSGRRGRRFESYHSDQSFQRLSGRAATHLVTLWHAFGTHWRANVGQSTASHLHNTLNDPNHPHALKSVDTLTPLG